MILKNKESIALTANALLKHMDTTYPSITKELSINSNLSRSSAKANKQET